MRSLLSGLLVVGAFVALSCEGLDAQVMYLRGQTVQPVFEGFDPHADGSATLWFGYMNRNFEEEPHIPIGQDNFFTVVEGGAHLEQIKPRVARQDAWRESDVTDRGQPTHFYPRRQRFVFGVTVPADFGEKELVWVVKRNGETFTAIGKLSPAYVWSLNHFVWSGIADPAFPNVPPTVEVEGQDAVTVAAGEPLVLTASVTDDGLPPAPDSRNLSRREEGTMAQGRVPPALANDLPTDVYRSTTFEPVFSPASARETGMAVTWMLYRGQGGVTFEPRVVPLDNSGGRATTTVRFPEAGTYEVRAYADDGLYTGVKFAGVTVTVVDRQ